jgi:thiol-disulfide isomerase/thioredoxin
LLATLGCRPESPPIEAPSSESSSAPDPGGPTAAESDEPAVDDPVEPAPDEPTEPSPDEPTEPTPDEISSTEVPPEAGPSEVEPVAVADERKPLPKPIHKAGTGKCVQKFAVGEKVKGFKLPSLAGDKTISPSGYRNRVVLLNFWALWCKPCLEELPEFDRLYRKYRSHGLTFVAVTTDEDPKPVQAFVDEHKLVAKVALEGEEAAGQYNRPQFPFSFVIDGKGTIVASFDYVSDACMGDLEQVIRESLEQLE